MLRSLRNFRDSSGDEWSAGVSEIPGPDYKGRFQLIFFGSDREAAPLEDIRWNTANSARRTLETMSEIELRRRLKDALGRWG